MNIKLKTWRDFDRLSRIELLLAAIGLIISIYLTVAHYTNIQVACPTSGVLNCDAVLSSQYAVLFGIPVAVLGLAFFLIYLILTFLGMQIARFVVTCFGIGFVMYFLYAEYMLGHICAYCSAVHIIVIALFIIFLYRFETDTTALP